MSNVTTYFSEFTVKFFLYLKVTYLLVSDIFVLCKGRKINVLYFVSVQFKAKLLMFVFDLFCFFKLG